MQEACLEGSDVPAAYAAATAAPPVEATEAAREETKEDLIVISDTDESDSEEPTTTVGFGHASPSICICMVRAHARTCVSRARARAHAYMPGMCGVACTARAQDAGEWCERVAW